MNKGLIEKCQLIELAVKEVGFISGKHGMNSIYIKFLK